MVNVGAWIDSHKQEAGMAGAGVAVLVLALFHKSRNAAAAAQSAAVTDTAGTAGGTAIPGGTIGVPGTTVADIQNAVQDQINDDVAALRNANQQQIALIPRGATGATGSVFVPTMNTLNYARADLGEPLFSAAQYHSMYPTGKVETAAEAAIIAQHAARYKAAHTPRKPPPPAPKPKPKPAPPKAKPHLPAAPTKPKTPVKLIPPVSKTVKK